jgi:hypothetical protein
VCNGLAVAEAGGRTAANLMTKDEAIAANIVKLPELLGRQQD